MPPLVRRYVKTAEQAIETGSPDDLLQLLYETVSRSQEEV